ncbi:MAG: DUF488 family protein [Nitriliruptorales bacterium]|nr:DUF488 family protein [Nitriliruptorales bacterium]
MYTIGHGTRSTEELVAVLVSADVRRVADVRRHPGSRRCPHLGRDVLSIDLPVEGIAYEWWGEALGGRRSRVPGSRHHAWRNASFQGYADHMDSDGFRSAFERLLAAASRVTTVVMCSETVWWRCHRRLLADAAVLRGVEAVHLLAADKHVAHLLHPDVRADTGGWPVYDRGQEQLPEGPRQRAD